LSDSDRAQLDDILTEREHEAWLQQRRTRLFDTLKTGAQWITAIMIGISMLKDTAVSAWHWTLHWLGVP
jgi:hypothetical protein